MTPKVSIIIPVYNAEKYIGQCLDSVCRQTFYNLEVLCIDDCSTDNSAEVIKKKAVHDSRIVFVKNDENLGAGETRNKGIMLAKGKYFFFLDADDFLDTDAIEKMYLCSEKHKLQLCICPHIIYSEKEKSLRKSLQTSYVFLKRYQDKVFSWNDVQRFFYQNVFCVPWNRLYLTRFVQESSIRFPNLKNSEDLFFGEAIVTIAERMGVVDSEKPLIYYRVGRNGQVSSMLEENPYCMLQSIMLLYNFLYDNCKLDNMKKSYYSTAIEMLIFSVASVKEKESIIKYIVEQGFPKIGMMGLKCDNFINNACFKKYCEFVEGRISYFDTYMVSLKEDKKKCDEIKYFLNQHNKEKIALWGIGKRGQALLCELGDTDGRFDYYIDSNTEKIIDGIKKIVIHRFEEIIEPLDYIMITNTYYYEEIYKKCKKKSADYKIIDLDTFFRCDMTIEECMV